MRSPPLLATLALTSCIAYQTLAIAPPPAVPLDSAARAAFTSSTMTLLDQIAKGDSLEPVDASEPLGTACFRQKQVGFRLCGHMDDSVMRIDLTQGGGGRFWGAGDDLRRSVIQRLRTAFGDQRVIECTQN